jgi:hypothetical protein
MTQSELEAMLKESDLMSYGLGKDGFKFFSACSTFAKLVATKEREACAEIAEKQRYAMNISLTSHPAQNGTAVQIANAIRARGEA